MARRRKGLRKLKMQILDIEKCVTEVGQNFGILGPSSVLEQSSRLQGRAVQKGSEFGLPVGKNLFVSSITTNRKLEFYKTLDRIISSKLQHVFLSNLIDLSNIAPLFSLYLPYVQNQSPLSRLSDPSSRSFRFTLLLSWSFTCCGHPFKCAWAYLSTSLIFPSSRF